MKFSDRPIAATQFVGNNIIIYIAGPEDIIHILDTPGEPPSIWSHQIEIPKNLLNPSTHIYTREMFSSVNQAMQYKLTGKLYD